MLTFIVMLLSTTNYVPRVVPLSLHASKRVLKRWDENASPSNREEYARARARYDFKVVNPSEWGSVGIVYNNSVHAVALMERVEDSVILWDVTCDDEYSGSLLMRAFSKQKSYEKINLGYTLHSRWKIAYSFFQDM